MNLFATSADPAEAAGWLDDGRVVNQCRETAQLVSTALVAAGLEAPYRPTHPHHPVTLWVQADARNFVWALDHLEALAHEHRRRFPRSNWHASWLLHARIADACRGVPRDRPERLQNSARRAELGLDFTGVADPTHAYRLYLAARWSMARALGRAPRWTSVGAPWWLLDDGSTTPYRVAPEATTDLRARPTLDAAA